MANLTKDQRILRDNPGKSPYELLMLGLSQAKYEELLAAEDKRHNAPTQKVPQKAEPVVKTSIPIRAIPQTTAPAPIIKGHHDMAVLWDKKAGRGLRMTKAQVLRQIKKYPNQYEMR